MGRVSKTRQPSGVGPQHLGANRVGIHGVYHELDRKFLQRSIRLLPEEPVSCLDGLYDEMMMEELSIAPRPGQLGKCNGLDTVSKPILEQSCFWSANDCGPDSRYSLKTGRTSPQLLRLDVSCHGPQANWKYGSCLAFGVERVTVYGARLPQLVEKSGHGNIPSRRAAQSSSCTTLSLKER